MIDPRVIESTVASSTVRVETEVEGWPIIRMSVS